MFRAIEVRTKSHPFIRDFAKFAEAEYLESARIGENRARPGHEFVQAAHLTDEFVAGTKIKVIGIRKKNLDAEICKVLLRLAFYRRGSAYGHEGRRVDDAVRRAKPPQACASGVGREDFKPKSFVI